MGNLLKEYRIKSGMTLGKASSTLGVSEEYLKSIENDKVSITKSFALKITCIYNLSSKEYNEILKLCKE